MFAVLVVCVCADQSAKRFLIPRWNSANVVLSMLLGYTYRTYARWCLTTSEFFLINEHD